MATGRIGGTEGDRFENLVIPYLSLHKECPLLKTDVMIGYQVDSTIGSNVIYFLLSRERIGL
jgi:hypothetical protein